MWSPAKARVACCDRRRLPASESPGHFACPSCAVRFSNNARAVGRIPRSARDTPVSLPKSWKPSLVTNRKPAPHAPQFKPLSANGPGVSTSDRSAALDHASRVVDPFAATGHASRSATLCIGPRLQPCRKTQPRWGFSPRPLFDCWALSACHKSTLPFRRGARTRADARFPMCGPVSSRVSTRHARVRSSRVGRGELQWLFCTAAMDRLHGLRTQHVDRQPGVAFPLQPRKPRNGA